MVLATATKIAGKALVKKLADTPYVVAMKKLAKIQHKIPRQELIKKIIHLQNTKRLKGGVRNEYSVDDMVTVGDTTPGTTTQIMKRGDTQPKITIFKGQGGGGWDKLHVSYRAPFEKTQRGRRAFIDSRLDELEKGIVGHYKKNKEKFGFKTNAEVEDWGRQRMMYSPLDTMERWARMQLGPVAKRKFGYSIFPPGSKVGGKASEEVPYAKGALSDLLTKKFGTRETVGDSYKYKTFQVRRQERDLENFLRRPTARSKQFPLLKGQTNADVVSSRELALGGKFPSLSLKRITKLRKDEGLEPKISDRSLIENIFGLTRWQAAAYSKIDPQLQGIFAMGQGKGPLGPKLQDMIRKYADPSKFSSEHAKNQAMLHRLHDRMIPYNPGIPPKAVSLLQRNNMHKSAESKLRALDDRVKSKEGSRGEVKEWKKEMKEIGEDMELLGLQSNVNGVVYGKWYAKPGDPAWKQLLPFFRSLKKEFPLKRLQMKGPTGKPEKYKHKRFEEGGLFTGYQAGGLVGIGSKILAKLAKKLSEKELKMLMGSLWKGVDPKQAPHYKAWAKNRWGPGYKWPYKKSRIRGPEMKKSHYASLSDQAKEDLRKRYAKRLAEYIAKKKRGG